MPPRYLPEAVPAAATEKKAATETRMTAIEDALGPIYIRWVNPPKWMA